MTDEKPYWLTLISYWVKNKNRTGLTIPFIIGAQAYFEVNPVHRTVADLLTSIKNSNINETIVLNNCGNVSEFVLGIDNHPFSLSGIEFENDNHKNSSLKATTSTKLLGNDFNSICESLQKRYSQHINNGNYSKDNFEWKPFTDEDIKMINKAKTQ